jgi:ribonuclease BN (tRNA processing enzyme)
MADVRLITVGVGDAFSTQHYTTCLALGCDSDWMLIDCPHPVRKMLFEAASSAGISIDLKDIQAVALTHLHADHCCGLEDYAFYSYFVLHRKAHLLTHPRVSERLWPNVLSAGMDQTLSWPDPPHIPATRDTYFEITDLNETAPTQFGPFAIECRPTKHSVPTTALRITAGGRTFGFSADSAFDPSLIEWLSPCDFIIHEATTLPESRVHTPYHHLAELPAALRAKMRLIHFPDDFDAANSKIEPLRQGHCYKI